MTILDCESVESTYRSIESILKVTRGDIERIFRSFDIERFYEDNPHHPDPPEKVLLE